MLAKLGLLAVVVLVGSESFIVSAAVLWPVAALAHLGPAFQTAAVGIAAIAGIATGLWIGWRAARQGYCAAVAECGASDPV